MQFWDFRRCCGNYLPKIAHFCAVRAKKFYRYAIGQDMCTLITYASLVLQLNLPHKNSFGLGVGLPAVAMTTTPIIVRNCCFCTPMPPQTFCAHFSHSSNELLLNLPHTRNSSLGYLPMLWQLSPQNYQKLLFLRCYALQGWLYDYRN